MMPHKRKSITLLTMLAFVLLFSASALAGTATYTYDANSRLLRYL